MSGYEWRFERVKYRPDQPRVPAGDPRGGRWTAGGGTTSSRFAEAATSGRIEGTKYLGGGVTGAQIVTYEDDGQGVWKELRIDTGSFGADFHDGNSEVAASRIADMLADDLVPEVVYAENEDGEWGTSQFFVNDEARVGRGLRGNERMEAFDNNQERMEAIVALDWIIGNDDRHDGNWLVDGDGKLWAIDHGHAGWDQEGWGGYGWARRLPNFDPGRATEIGGVPIHRTVKRLFLTPGLLGRIRGIDRDSFFDALSDVGEDYNVNLATAWGRIRYMQKHGYILFSDRLELPE